MCAILGLFSKSSAIEKLQKSAEKKLNMMNSRGPDYSATEVIRTKKYKGVVGHNRLAIIDLDSRSNQPIYDSSKRYILVFNGEIFNAPELRMQLEAKGVQFDSGHSDTEVILRMYEAEGPEYQQDGADGGSGACGIDFSKARLICPLSLG